MNKIIKDYPKYKASSEGYIIGTKGILKHNMSNNGYCLINIYNSFGRRNTTVHRLIAETFISNPKKLPCVNHKNGNKTDNRLLNLEWVSLSGNMKHFFRTGDTNKFRNSAKIRMKKIGTQYGTLNGLKKQGRDGVSVYAIKNKKVIAKYASIRYAEKCTGFCRTGISKAISNGKIYKGLSWELK